MPADDVGDVIETVGRRADVLRRVGPEGLRKRDLVADLSVSRSTVDRAVRELADAELIRRSDDGYVRTLAGDLALREYDRLTGRIDGVVEATDVLDPLDADAPFDARLLDGATVVPAVAPSPRRPLRHLTDLVERSSHVVAFAPAVFPAQVDAYRDRTLDGSLTARVVVTAEVVERLVSTYRADFLSILETGRLSIRRHTALPSYSLTVGETPEGPELGIVTYSDNRICGFVGNDDPAAVEWARHEVGRRWASSDPVVAPDADPAGESGA
jgi:predicted transcriptional regulator